MSDYPSGGRPHKPTFGTWDFRKYSTKNNSSSSGSNGADLPPASGAWPSANLAMYIPFTIQVPYLVTKLWWINGGTANGNVDCGIMAASSGRKLTSTGSTAQSGTSALQSVTLGTAILLQPDQYYLALGLSSATGTIRFVTQIDSAVTNAEIDGLLQEASAVALPASATFAAYAQTVGLPICGMSNATIL